MFISDGLVVSSATYMIVVIFRLIFTVHRLHLLQERTKRGREGGGRGEHIMTFTYMTTAHMVRTGVWSYFILACALDGTSDEGSPSLNCCVVWTYDRMTACVYDRMRVIFQHTFWYPTRNLFMVFSILLTRRYLSSSFFSVMARRLWAISSPARSVFSEGRRGVGRGGEGEAESELLYWKTNLQRPVGAFTWQQTDPSAHQGRPAVRWCQHPSHPLGR